jgi:hydroxymethylpyrimidine/phosphomethylpyrimidine kinase
MVMTAIALTIAGSDSSGGAGIQADLKTFSALGVYGASAITALTAQNTHGVEAVHAVPPDFIRQQIEVVARDLVIGAIKIGMLATSPIIKAVAKGLDAMPGVPVVLDPVMVAASGDSLLDEDAVETLRAVLVPRATLITPNLPEAAKLLGQGRAKDEREMAAQARALHRLGADAVLIKGGHAEGKEAVDILSDSEGELWLAAPRVKTCNTHGTGCTLSSAIAAELAKGASLRDAVAAAKAYVTAAIEAADQLQIGKGRGPVHHFHALWPRAPKKTKLRPRS